MKNSTWNLIFVMVIINLGFSLYGKARASKSSQNPPATRNDKTVIAVDRSAVKSYGGSESNRMEKHGMVGLKYGAPGAGMLMKGGEVIALLGARFQLGISYFKEEKDFTQQVNSDLKTASLSMFSADHVVLGGEVAMVNVRYFFGNSFFASAGVGQRSYDFHFGFKQKSTLALASFDPLMETEMKAKSIVSSISIGNQWLFDNGLTLTGEWIGVAVPLTSSYAMKNNYDPIFVQSGVVPDVDRIVEKLGEVMSKSSQAIMMLSLGWAL